MITIPTGMKAHVIAIDENGNKIYEDVKKAGNVLYFRAMVVNYIRVILFLFFIFQCNRFESSDMESNLKLSAGFIYHYISTSNGIKIDSSFADIYLRFQSDKIDIIKLKYSEIYDINYIYNNRKNEDNLLHSILIETDSGDGFDIFNHVYCSKDTMPFSGSQAFTSKEEIYFETKSATKLNEAVFILPIPLDMNMLTKCYPNKKIRFQVTGSLVSECNERIFNISSNWIKT